MTHKDSARHREYMREWYRRNPEKRKKHLVLVRKNKERYEAQKQALIDDFKKGGCALCPEKHPCCLSAHHVDPGKKKFGISTAAWKTGLGPEKIKEELKKCVCLCENCHRKVHAGVVKLRSRVRRRAS